MEKLQCFNIWRRKGAVIFHWIIPWHEILRLPNPDLFLQRYQPPVMVDEIQYAPQLLPYIKLYVDEHKNKGDFWLTGPQVFHLMKGVSESLAGRVGIVNMLGLSYSEIIGAESSAFKIIPPSGLLMISGNSETRGLWVYANSVCVRGWATGRRVRCGRAGKPGVERWRTPGTASGKVHETPA